MAGVNVESILEAEGHLVDSQILTSVFDAVIRHDSAFEVLSFDIGRTNEDYSRLRLKVSAPDQSRLSSLLEELLALGCHPLAENGRDGAARRQGRLRARGLLLHHQPPHRRPPRRALDRGRAAADGRRDHRRGRRGDVPQAARRAARRSHRLRQRRHPRRARVPRARPARLRVHDQRDLVGAAGRGQHRQDRRDDARHQARRRQDRVRDGPGGRAHRRHQLFQRHRPQGLRERGAVRQRAGRPRRRARAVRHVARRRPGSRLTGEGRPPQPHAGDQRREPRRRHPGRGRQRRPEVRHHVRAREARRALRARRQHPRRRAARRHRDGPRRGAGRLRRGADRREAGADAVDDAARHRRRQHAAGVGEGDLRRHQPRRRDEARRPGIQSDDRPRHRRRVVPAAARGETGA